MIIDKNTGCEATQEEVDEWEEYNQSLPPHNYTWQCDCRQCKGERFQVLE